MRQTSILLATALLLSASCGVARADFVTDPTGDFLAGYVGPRAGDLDVLSAGVTFDGTRFVLSATMNGTIGTTAGALYVWGVDRGAGTARFPTLAPGVTFDSVVSLQAVRDATGALVGAGTVTLIVGGGSTTLTASDVLISGNTITATVLASALPSQGFTPANDTFNLWPRVGTGNNNQISDFAPDNSNLRASSVPEPSSLLLGGVAGLGGLAWRAFRRRSS